MSVAAQLTSFVGRQQELHEVRERLRTSRLVTLAGPGGIGKTRLALAAVADADCDTYIAELAGLVDDAGVAEAVRAAVIDASFVETQSRDPLDVAAEQLRGRAAVLVLDNCEHVVAGSAAVTAALLAAEPALRILATSREPLAVPGEIVWRVPGLLPAEAVQLFAARAGRDLPRDEVERLCDMLDALPLAIELAAARASTLSLHDITVRLRDRLSLLTSRARGVPTRQQTMREAIAWSHELLDDEERLLFRRLAVFAGGFSMDAVEAVCAGRGLPRDQLVDVLSRLVDKSLVVATVDRSDARYHLLETIRHFALEQLVTGPPDVVSRSTWSMRREGDVWALADGDAVTRIRHARGIGYLAVLLAEPGREWSAVDLAGGGADPGDAGETLDEAAKRAYKRRIEALEEEIDEARSWNDPERAARAEGEREFIIHELARDLGIGGRARRASSDTERARSAVTQAIRGSIRRIAEQQPAIGRHLERAIRTGTRCSYSPGPDEPGCLHLSS